MKNIFLLVLLFAAFTTVKAQTAAASLSEIKVSQDTASGPVVQNLGFEVTLNSLATTQSLTITLLDASGSSLATIGSYTLVAGQNNFYYLNSAANEKKSVLGNKVSFLYPAGSGMYNAAGSIQLSVTMNNGSVQTSTKTLSK